MSNQTEWNRVFGGEQEGADAWSELFREYFGKSKPANGDAYQSDSEFEQLPHGSLEEHTQFAIDNKRNIIGVSLHGKRQPSDGDGRE